MRACVRVLVRMCVRVRVRVCMCVRACACVCVCFTRQATYIYFSIAMALKWYIGDVNYTVY